MKNDSVHDAYSALILVRT